MPTIELPTMGTGFWMIRLHKAQGIHCEHSVPGMKRLTRLDFRLAMLRMSKDSTQVLLSPLALQQFGTSGIVNGRRSC